MRLLLAFRRGGRLHDPADCVHELGPPRLLAQEPPPASVAARVAGIVSALISAGLVLAAVWLAVTNVLASRADREGAYRVAVIAFAIQMVRWLLEPSHSSEPATEALRLYMGLAFGLLFASVVGGAYLGLEPFVRRYWPRALVGWTRLLGGRRRRDSRPCCP